MLTRRELVTGTAIGALATIATPDTDAASDTVTTADSSSAPNGTPAQEVDNAALRRIADRIDWLAGNPARSREMGMAGYDRYRKLDLTWERTASVLLQRRDMA